jgi:hypothetical protein
LAATAFDNFSTASSAFKRKSDNSHSSSFPFPSGFGPVDLRLKPGLLPSSVFTFSVVAGGAWDSANRTLASVRLRDERYADGRRSERGGCGSGRVPCR